MIICCRHSVYNTNGRPIFTGASLILCVCVPKKDYNKLRIVLVDVGFILTVCVCVYYQIQLIFWVLLMWMLEKAQNNDFWIRKVLIVDKCINFINILQKWRPVSVKIFTKNQSHILFVVAPDDDYDILHMHTNTHTHTNSLKRLYVLIIKRICIKC